MAGEADGEVVVPPTLQALLAARLDQLETAERSVLERGAIEGEIFHRGAVQALAPEETQVTPRLAALVRKELIRPDTPQLAGEDGFRFRHLLIRDAAYDALPKATRAELHERFASWLEQHGTELVELDEILGYHLEQACRYRAELGTPDDGDPGRRGAAAPDCGRSPRGPPPGLRRRREPARARRRARAADRVRPRPRDRARRRPVLDRQGRRCAPARRCPRRARLCGGRSCRRALREDPGGHLRGSTSSRRARQRSWPRSSSRRCPCFETAGDDLALYVAYSALAEVAGMRAQMDAGLEACERAFAHARQAGHQPAGVLGALAAYRFFGTTPVSELLAWLDENEPRAGAGSLPPRLPGRGAGDARSVRRGARDPRRGACGVRQSAAGGSCSRTSLAFESVWIELWAGDPAAAAEFGAEGFRLHEELGEQSFLSAAAANLAQALYALDRLDEADAWAGRAAELGASDDARKEMLWRQVRAKVLARRGEHAEAERLAREAVAICDETDMLDAQGDVYADLAEVLLLAGKPGGGSRGTRAGTRSLRTEGEPRHGPAGA